MKYLASFVQRPTVAPTPSDNTPGTHELAHQRQNKAGGYTEARVVSGVTLPNTATFQAYTDSAELLADRILVRQTGQATWKQVPASQISGQTVTLPSSIPSNWATISNEELADNQALQTIDGLDFGTFSSAAEPERSVYLLNDGTDTIESLTLGVRSNSGQLLGVLDNRLQLDILGTLSTEGLGALTTTFNGNLVFGVQARNTLELTLGRGQAVKLRLTLVNFPATGLPSEAISAELLLTPNFSRTSAPAWLDWPTGTLAADSQYAYLDLVQEDPASLGVLVQPFAYRFEGSVVFRDTPTTFLPTTSGLNRLELSPEGIPAVVPDSQPLGDNLALYRFTWNSSTGAVTDGLPLVPAKADTAWLGPDTAITPNRFVRATSTGLTNGAKGAIGIAQGELGYYVPTGYALLELGEAVNAGDRLGPSSVGLGVVDPEGPATALLGGASGATVPVFLRPTGGSGGGGEAEPTNLDVTRVSTSVTITSSTGTDALVLGATTSSAGVMSSVDKFKLNGIATGATANQTDSFLLDRANHTGTQPVGTILGMDEYVDDRVDALLLVGNGITKVYDDAAGTLTLSATAQPVDLSVTPSSTTLTVVNSGGTNAVLGAATPSNAGLILPSEKSKLGGIATGATANQTDSFLLNRANHTGTQAISTVAGLADALGLVYAVWRPNVSTPQPLPLNTFVGMAGSILSSRGSWSLMAGSQGVVAPLAGSYLVVCGGVIRSPASTGRALFAVNSVNFQTVNNASTWSVIDTHFNYVTELRLGSGGSNILPQLYMDNSSGSPTYLIASMIVIYIGP